MIDTYSFMWGLATLPLLVGVGFGIWMIIEPVSKNTSTSCGGPCKPRWQLMAGRQEPWWVWELRSNRQFARHIMRNEACREYANHWLERRKMPGRWTAKGFKKRAAL